jgi:hypothetical protein
MPAHGRALAIPLPDLSPLGGSPAAVVMRLRGATEPTRIAIALDDTTIADLVLPPNRDIRVDGSTSPPAGAGHQLHVSSDREGWQVSYLEIANVHGFSRGVLGFVIVPRERDEFRSVPWWLLAPIVVGLLALQPRPEWPPGPIRRRVHRSGIGIVLLLFLTALVADRVTQFKLLLSFETFLLCVAILYAERTLQAWRALGPPALATARAILAGWRWTVRTVSTIAARPWVPPAIAGTAAIAVGAMALTLGAHYAGGADAYGYVSQSELWARGQLYVDQPIASELPPYANEWTITPLGFVVQTHSGVRGRIVPSYSPGLPMMMAPLRLALGPNAIYLIVPALAGITVWLTYVLGRRLDGSATGLFAALWLASSPAFLGSSLNPMSDVPVTAWWLIAFLAVLRPTVGSAAVAGIATSLAVLTRPNLAPLAVLIALPFVGRWFAQSRARARGVELGVFLATAAVGPIAIAVLYDYWYGSPLSSGYGSSIYCWSSILPNLARYPRWLIDTQTPLILAGLATPFLLRGRDGARDRLRPAAFAWLMLALAALVWGCYLVYFYFEAWWYLRFMLPSYPPLIALASAALVFALRRTAAPRLLGTTLLVLIAAHGLTFCWKNYVFTIATGEARYQRVGDFAARSLPEGSVLLSMQHSGNLRYYSHLTTIRYDHIPRARLDDVVAHFQARGRAVYIVLDEWEKQEFRKLFASENVLGTLEWTPMAVAPGSIPVTIYDPRDRVATRAVGTQIIP